MERFRQTIHDEAPALRDAVIEAFRFQRQDVGRIATPELLDDLAETSLGLRFGDAAFGREVYGDIKHQAITAEERWYDARIDATLAIARVRGEASNPFFDLIVRWSIKWYRGTDSGSSRWCQTDGATRSWWPSAGRRACGIAGQRPGLTSPTRRYSRWSSSPWTETKYLSSAR